MDPTMVGSIVVLGALLYRTGGGYSVPDESSFSLATATPRAAATATPSSVLSATPSPSQRATSTRFDGWRFAQYSYQIYPGDPNEDAKKALAGFQLSVQDQGDTVLLELKATNSRYRDASYTVPKEDTAYFVETTMRDDPNDQEQNLGDDGVVTVNPEGYLIGS